MRSIYLFILLLPACDRSTDDSAESDASALAPSLDEDFQQRVLPNACVASDLTTSAGTSRSMITIYAPHFITAACNQGGITRTINLPDPLVTVILERGRGLPTACTDLFPPGYRLDQELRPISGTLTLRAEMAPGATLGDPDSRVWVRLDNVQFADPATGVALPIITPLEWSDTWTFTGWWDTAGINTPCAP